MKPIPINDRVIPGHPKTQIFDKLEQLITYEQLAEWMQLSRRTIEKYVQRSEIPFVRLNGRTVRFRVADIRRWLLSKEGRSSYA